MFYLLANSLGELSFISGTRFDDGDLELYSLSILISFLFIFFLNEFESKPIKVYKFKNHFNSKYVLILSFISFLFFLSFIFSNVNRLEDLLLFAEKYRNGFFKGSGIYTFPILTIIPTILCFFILKIRRINYHLILSLVLVLIASLTIGLRIFLFGILFFIMIRIFTSSSKKKIIIYFLPILIVFMSYKYFLNENTKSLTSEQTVFYFLGRLNLRSILEFNNFSRDISDLKCSLIPINYLFDCKTSDFKETFLSGQPDISYGMPYINSYAGVALPIPVILYNFFGYFTSIFLIPYLIILLSLVFKVLTSKNIYKTLLYIILINTFVMGLVEDINIFNKLPIMIFCSFFIYHFLVFISKSKQNYKS